MKYRLLFISFLFCLSRLNAAEKDSAIVLHLPDSVKAVSVIADVMFDPTSSKKAFAGIRTASVSLELEKEKKEREVVFRFPDQAKIVATGINVEEDDDELEWEFDWKDGVTYKLLIASAGDSAGNFVLYSGYIFLPDQSKWKLIGTCRIEGRYETIGSPVSLVGSNRARPLFSNAWVQRTNGAWFQLRFPQDNNDVVFPRPVINPMPNIDSVQQYQNEKAILEKDIASGKTDMSGNVEGVYYKIIEPGTGKTVSVSDTVTVKYQLRIYNTTAIIDQATEKPATFPLNRLIKAWQLAIPLVKTGGKLRIVIPSGLAYSIRTRAPKIPPNSILEFDIEVLDTKPATK